MNPLVARRSERSRPASKRPGKSFRNLRFNSVISRSRLVLQCAEFSITYTLEWERLREKEVSGDACSRYG
jgi:hypothetical protein